MRSETEKKKRSLNFSRPVCGIDRTTKADQKTDSGGKVSADQTGMVGQGREDNGSMLQR